MARSVGAVLAGAVAVLAPGAGVAAARAPARPAQASQYLVGAARADVTPASLAGFYLGGYGIGPVHKATSVLRHIYFRVIAIRGRTGGQVVIGSLDAQGYSVAYQQGPYGFRDVEDDLHAKLGIPVSHIVLQATHSHNGPDEIGVWGGVPDAYFAFVKSQMERATLSAVRRERPARLRVGTANMAGFSTTFGTGADGAAAGDQADYPIDQQLRVLQAVEPRGRVLATMVNYSSHPTVYGPLNKVSPDWPGATATYLEGDELRMPARLQYGYPGSVAVVTVGALGHTWPAAVPTADRDPQRDPSPAADDNYPADQFGNAVARQAIAALSRHRGLWLTGSRVAGAERRVYVQNTNPVLAVAGNQPANPTPLGGYKIGRANTPPWAYGDTFVSLVTALRIGDLALFSVPGEPYPSIRSWLAADVHARLTFIFGLAQDQLGYVEEPGDYNGALQCSATDEGFFTISPVFGSDVVRLQRANARALGFRVSGSSLTPYGPGTIPPSTNCTRQQLGMAGLPALPGLP